MIVEGGEGDESAYYVEDYVFGHVISVKMEMLESHVIEICVIVWQNVGRFGTWRHAVDAVTFEYLDRISTRTFSRQYSRGLPYQHHL